MGVCRTSLFKGTMPATSASGLIRARRHTSQAPT
ncbi:hypothetical protein CI41S_66590 [Bradyrhizobium ivorense]|nr:hypothetical protein CI41S_66590 [Bradyrhizobium ivorense]